jgi:hypothetical protein
MPKFNVRDEVLGHECENAGLKENKTGGRMTEEYKNQRLSSE